MPSERRSSAGPSPDNCRSCGELNAPRRDDHLGVGARGPRLAADQIFDAGGAAAVEQDARRRAPPTPRAGCRAARRLEIGRRGRGAHAVAHGGLVEARALLRRAVEIVVARIAALLRRLDEGRGERMLVAHVRHAERPAGAVVLVGAALVVLGLAEVRQHVLVAPAGVAELAPVVEVLGLAADVDQAVDRARSAEHLAARRDDVAAVALRLRLGLVAPVVALVGEQLAVAERDVQPRMPVARPGLQQQHAMACRTRSAGSPARSRRCRRRR